MNAIDHIYAKSTAFGRDIFHYLVSGMMLMLIVAIPFAFGKPILPDSLNRLFGDSGWLIASVLFMVAIVAYALGHIVMSIGFMFRNLWVLLFSRTLHVKKFKTAKRKLSELTKKANPKIFESLPSEADINLYCEIVSFKQDAELHTKFIERYNSLAYLRLGLASSFLVGGLLDVVHGIIVWINEGLSVSILLFSSALLGIALLLLRQQVVTMTNFLNRLSVVYQVVVNKES